MFASDAFSPDGLSLLFNPSLFLNKFREIEPAKIHFPKFPSPIQKNQMENAHFANGLPSSHAFLQSKEFFDSLRNLWRRTMAAFSANVCEQFAPPPRLFLCDNPFEEFVALVEHRLRMCRKGQMGGLSVGTVPPMLNDKWINASLIISSLIASEQRIQKFHSTLRRFKEGVMEQFDSLKQLLQFEQFFVSDFDQFTETVTILDEETMHTTKNMIMLLTMDFITFIELFKMLPVFALLEVDDQVCLVNSLAIVLLGLSERYHSSRWKSETVLKLSNGFCPIFIFYKNPQIVGSDGMGKVNLVYCRAMRCFNKVQPTIEEYLLLRAIAMCHSAFDGLSLHAQRLLQREAEHYADVLLQFVQSQHGDLAGAKRYAELLELVGGVFYVADKQRQVHSLLLAKPNGEEGTTVPKAMSEMCLDRREAEGTRRTECQKRKNGMSKKGGRNAKKRNSAKGHFI